jgi:hypothetical protein
MEQQGQQDRGVAGDAMDSAAYLFPRRMCGLISEAENTGEHVENRVSSAWPEAENADIETLS